MNGSDIAMLSSLLDVIRQIGAWPLTAFCVAIVLGPWLGVWMFTRRYESRIEAITRMYENNVALVEDYGKLADSLQDLVVLNVQAMTNLKAAVDANLFCPLMRKDQKVEVKIQP